MNLLNPDIFNFLNELKNNNNREWFNSNKDRYLLIRESIKDFSNSIKNKIDEFDNIDKVKIFRIYRDVRFSKDKTPYKKNFGISFHRKKPELRGGYYIHIEENKTFIACGFWNPNKDDLFRIRKEFQIDSLELKKQLENNGINVHTKTPNVLSEEAPGAYKDVDEVIRLTCEAGLARPVARMKPFAVIKG